MLRICGFAWGCVGNLSFKFANNSKVVVLLQHSNGNKSGATFTLFVHAVLHLNQQYYLNIVAHLVCVLIQPVLNSPIVELLVIFQNRPLGAFLSSRAQNCRLSSWSSGVFSPCWCSVTDNWCSSGVFWCPLADNSSSGVHGSPQDSSNSALPLSCRPLTGHHGLFSGQYHKAQQRTPPRWRRGFWQILSFQRRNFPSLLSGSLEVDENHTGPYTSFPCDIHPDRLHTDGQDASLKSQAMSLFF